MQCQLHEGLHAAATRQQLRIIAHPCLLWQLRKVVQVLEGLLQVTSRT